MTRDDAQAADEALDALVSELAASAQRLQELVERATELRARRAAGTPWGELVPAEPRPLVVEHLAQVLDRVGECSARFRRAEARALAADGFSHARIAALFGVTRQRVGALLGGGQRQR